jgi:Zn-dependent protease
MGQEQLLTYLPFIVVFLVSGSAHEFCHAWAAYRLGDSTSRELGRLSLNPLVHMDLIGSVVFPMILIYSNAPFLFGWMKPVPVSSVCFRKPYRDMFLVALAGPLANLFLASLGFVVLLGFQASDMVVPRSVEIWILLNLLLALFNLLPIPPLDGSSVVDFVRKDNRGWYHSQTFMGGIIICALLLTRGFSHLWIIIEKIYFNVSASPFLSLPIFTILVVLGAVFYVKTAGRTQKPRIRQPRISPSQAAYSRAHDIGRKLAAGHPLSAKEEGWLAKIRRDKGDGQTLCAPLSYNPKNDFCVDCANFNRCAYRLIEALQGGEDPSSKQ